jgi:hypothetical protein
MIGWSEARATCESLVVKSVATDDEVRSLGRPEEEEGKGRISL